MSITIDATVPPNTESPRNGATRIRNLAAGLLGLLNLPTGSAQTIGGPFITSQDAGGVPTFVTGSLVASDPTAALGLVTKQYADAKVPYVVATGGDAYAGTFADIASLTGGQYIQVKFPAANVGTSPTFNLNALGAIPIKTVTGGSPAIGTIGASGIYLMVYDSATATWVLSGLTNAAAPVFPLQSDVSANSHKITTLANAAVSGDALNLGQFPGTNAASGNVKIPALVGGVLVTFILQWGTVPVANVNSNAFNTTAVTFSTAFASAVYSVVVGAIAANDNGAFHAVTSAQSGSVTNSGFTLQVGNNGTNPFNIGAYWIAVGQ